MHSVCTTLAPKIREYDEYNRRIADKTTKTLLILKELQLIGLKPQIPHTPKFSFVIFKKEKAATFSFSFPVGSFQPSPSAWAGQLSIVN